ncbi:hypothetical protein Nepgr_033678 [Nepenthes gracilis]|uniref:Uncharacterized protein n=1 Tax=Nepenthes gracilis TaxID=150966 RepID=A0AAD3TMH5_NEPGR|nr:hypothetical protein Nepgr_033678 [Nepenthes gracilis]
MTEWAEPPTSSDRPQNTASKASEEEGGGPEATGEAETTAGEETLSKTGGKGEEERRDESKTGEERREEIGSRVFGTMRRRRKRRGATSERKSGGKNEDRSPRQPNQKPKQMEKWIGTAGYQIPIPAAAKSHQLLFARNTQQTNELMMSGEKDQAKIYGDRPSSASSWEQAFCSSKTVVANLYDRFNI